MTEENVPHPPIASREEWLKARRELLVKEKEATRFKDRNAAELRRLPMVKIDKNYEFDGPDGKVSLVDLFDGKRQLVVYHFMFDPSWDKGCPGCTWYANAVGDLSDLEKKNTRFVMISRAELPKLEAYRDEKGWKFPWYSSFGSDFNYDFHVTHDPAVTPPDYNFMGHDAFVASRPKDMPFGEAPGLSVFFRVGDEVFHTYSSFARGVEFLTNSAAILDVTPYGRQEDWEDSPEGWPQQPTYG